MINKNLHKLMTVILLILAVTILAGCIESNEVESTTQEKQVNESAVLTGTWSEETHSNEAEPNYDVVFNQEEVLKMYITIDAEDWEVMNKDLEDNLSSFNVGKDKNRDQMATVSEETDYEPIWVESTITFEDDTWEHVGIRFKGNSSLFSTAKSGNEKLSFKLDFDEFEEDYTEIENQRFYGFKQLNLNNNFSDQSLLREKVGADMFRDFGLVSAKTSFCAVYVDYGEGSQYFGLYTIVEEMDDTVLDEQLGDDSGNLYKPDGDAASFAEGTYDEDEMEKKSNEEEADYDDVEALYTIINSSLRSTDPEVWKSDLEDIFNVDGFLKWLAVNTVIQNWDTYGNMTHNYYLYNDPDAGLLNWIPWDNNEAFSNGKQGGAISLELTEVSSDWPLIRYIADIAEYREIYNGYVYAFVEEVFNEEHMTELYDTYYELIKSYAYAEESGYTFINSDASFDAAVETLKEHVVERNEAVEKYLD